MQAIIITIGDELLMGDIIDTNRLFITSRLIDKGILIKRAVSVPDDKNEIKEMIQTSLFTADLVIMTGGLGPTKDDVTKSVLCEVFNTSLQQDKKVLENIKQVLSFKNKPLNKRNIEQAYVPLTATVINNNNGTAPGLWFEKDKKILVALPGVPFEMKEMFDNDVLPRIVNRFNPVPLLFKKILLQGISESVLAEKLEAFEQNLPENMSLAYMASPGTIKLKLLAKEKDVSILQKEIERQVTILNRYVGEYIFGYDDDTFEGITGNLLKQYHKTLSVAESCTGGNIGRLITSVPGSSGYFNGGVIAYSNDIKKNILGVREETLKKYGAVSNPVVQEMVEGIRNKFNTDFAIAVSGIAGPSGGTNEKPVGTTCIAVAGNHNMFVKKYVFGNVRIRNIQKASFTALHELIKIIKSENA